MSTYSRFQPFIRLVLYNTVSVDRLTYELVRSMKTAFHIIIFVNDFDRVEVYSLVRRTIVLTAPVEYYVKSNKSARRRVVKTYSYLITNKKHSIRRVFCSLYLHTARKKK